MKFLEQKIETDNYTLEPITISHANTLFDLIKAKDLYTFIPNDAPIPVEKLKQKYEIWEKDILQLEMKFG